MGLVLSAVTLTGALAACSGGGPAPPTPTAAATSTTAPVPPSFSGEGSERFCEQARVAEADLERLSTVGASPEAARAVFTSTAAAVRTLADVAPAEIAADARVMAGAYEDLVRGLEQVRWELARLPPEAAAKVDSPQVQVAGDRLRTYEQQVCGIGR